MSNARGGNFARTVMRTTMAHKLEGYKHAAQRNLSSIKLSYLVNAPVLMLYIISRRTIESVLYENEDMSTDSSTSKATYCLNPVRRLDSRTQSEDAITTSATTPEPKAMYRRYWGEVIVRPYYINRPRLTEISENLAYVPRTALSVTWGIRHLLRADIQFLPANREC